MTSGPEETFARLAADAAARFDERADTDLLLAWRDLSFPDIRKDLIARLSAAGIEPAEPEARFLLTAALEGRDLAGALAGEPPVSWRVVDYLSELAWKRLQRIPLSQVLGSQPFWTLDLTVSDAVLTPRADTETLVETALRLQTAERARVLDLGTGSGAILLALLAERPHWRGIGVDASAEALSIALQNADRSQLSERAAFSLGDWGEGLADHAFDLIVSNPPYIASAEIDTLDPEVRDHEPRLALDGGQDGLDAYRRILADLKRLAAPGAVFALEIGHDQGESVAALARDEGLLGVECIADLAGKDRVIAGRMA